jgi:hypothetical protein
MIPKDDELEEPYREALAGVLTFSTFAAAEHTLRCLENLCRKYRLASDKKGVEACRRMAFLGRRRAESISRNPRVCLRKRLHKREVAAWFRIWLETPDLFDDWLSMRKNTAEFRELLESESADRPDPKDKNARGNKTS